MRGILSLLLRLVPLVVGSGVAPAVSLSYGPANFLADFSHFWVADLGRKCTGSLADSVYLRSSIDLPTQPTLRSVNMMLVPGPSDVAALDRESPLRTDGASFTVTRTKPFASRRATSASAEQAGEQRVGVPVR